MSRRAACAGILAATLMCASGSARAQLTATGLQDRKATPEMNARKFRSGLFVALLTGYGISGASGYPNNSSQIGNPAYYSSSDLMVGSGSGLYIGGALADYVNFGFFFGGQKYTSHNWTSTAAGIGFRLEAFPLVYAVPALKNLGAFTQLGLGSGTLQAQNGNYPQALGVQSLIGVGVLYEIPIFHVLGGHGVVGPTLEYDTVYSTSLASGSGLLGVRFGFYGGM